MSVRHHIIFWGAAATSFIVAVLLFKSILLPFVLGFAIAYLLNPLIKRLGANGLTRGLAVIVILGVFFVALLAILGAVIPLAYNESLQLVASMPGYIDSLISLIQPLSDKLQNAIGRPETLDIQALFKDHAASALNVSKKVAQGLVSGGQAIMDLISVIVFTPIVAYFVMKEWNNITNWIIDLMPRDQKSTIMDLLKQIDQ